MNRFYTFLISTILILFVGISNSYAQDLLVPQPYSIELEDSAEMGIPEAQYKMGKHCYQQYEFIKNKFKYQTDKIKQEGKPYLEKALSFFKSAAGKGNVGAMYGLSKTYYEKNDNVTRTDSAFVWLTKAVAAGNADALFKMYEVYMFGQMSVKRNDKLAKSYFEKALSKGSAEAYKKKYLQTKDKAEQFKYVQLLAEKGEPCGLSGLAKAYLEGIYVPKNTQKAIDYFERNKMYSYLDSYYLSIGDTAKYIWTLARMMSNGNHNAEGRLRSIKNHPIAQYWMAAECLQDSSLFGMKFKNGHLSIDEGLSYLLLSAQQGYAPAMGKYATKLVYTTKGYEWAVKGAELNDPWAQYALALCYLYNHEVCKKDSDQALKYLTKAAKGGVLRAQKFLADIYLKGYIDNINKDVRKAIDLYEMAAQQNDIEAFKTLGDLYEKQGEYIKSYQNFLKAANQKDPYATFRLALHYAYSYNSQYDGGTSRADSLRNTQKGLRLLHKADSLGNANAPWYIGLFHQLGFGVNKDIGKTIEYYKKAAERGASFASRDLADIYYEGKLVEKNDDLAFKYAKEAAENAKWGPMTSSMRLLSACFRAGVGTKRDDAKAKYWLEQAAKNKDDAAIEILSGVAEKTLDDLYYRPQ